MNNELWHSGIKGQKWGIRRFQNPDGTLTELGKQRYSQKIQKLQEKFLKKESKIKNKKKAAEENARLRRKAILNSPSLLYKYRDEFTKKDIEAAMEKFDTTEKLRRRLSENEEQRKYDKAKSRLKDKLEFERERLNNEKTKVEIERQKIENKKSESEFLKKSSKKSSKDKKLAKLKYDANKWSELSKKYGGVKKFTTDSKSLLDDMGITDPKSGKTLLGSLGVALGLKDITISSENKNGKDKKSKE